MSVWKLLKVQHSPQFFIVVPWYWVHPHRKRDWIYIPWCYACSFSSQEFWLNEFHRPPERLTPLGIMGTNRGTLSINLSVQYCRDVWRVSRDPLIMPPWCWKALPSRTSVSLTAVEFPLTSRNLFWHYSRSWSFNTTLGYCAVGQFAIRKKLN